MSVTIKLTNIVPRLDYLRFKSPINWTLLPNEQWVLIGENGSGKSLLIDILLGKHALLPSCKIVCRAEDNEEPKLTEVVRSVAFNDIYSLVDTNNSYYQQRWNKGIQPDQEVAKVEQLLNQDEKKQLNSLRKYFKIDDLLDKEVTLLSSGELRKFLVIRSILSNPQILILDNPYIGLDGDSRKILTELFDQLVIQGVRLVLLVADPQDIPPCITNILVLKDREIVNNLTKDEFFKGTNIFRPYPTTLKDLDDYKNPIPAIYDKVALLKNVTVKYGERTILRNLNWEINKGDKWALLGKNGSGKSTLLSLVCGDNPQAYANDIILFDRKRGTGESIWDIKKQIGYVSPEMHLYYLKNVPCLDVVGSGLFDTIGLYKKCNQQQLEQARRWMQIFDIEYLADTSFMHISTGEQRLVLLARVFVKNPNLIILDEPMHGLDVERKKQVKKIIERFCDSSKTIIFVTHYLDEIPNIIDQKLELIKIV